MVRFFVLGALLSGCAAFAPPYQAEADRMATESFAATSELLAKAELGEFVTPQSYPPAVDTYAKAISGMETARLLASTGGTATEAAETAKATQLAVIDACLANIKSLAGLHRSGGLIPGTGATQPVRVACDQAVRAIQALR